MREDRRIKRTEIRTTTGWRLEWTWLRNQTDKAAPCLEVIIINCVVDSFSS